LKPDLIKKGKNESTNKIPIGIRERGATFVPPIRLESIVKLLTGKRINNIFQILKERESERIIA
jgi:hypothetical protein